MNITRFALVVAALTVEALKVSGEQPNAPPRFEDYPATGGFEGAPVPANIVTPLQRRYRTRIREGVEKGWGVYRDGREQHKPGPNFASDIVVIQWGCGTACLMVAMVNAHTGEIHNLPLAVDNTFAMPLLSIGCCSAGRGPGLEFRQDSRLMVISASPNWFKENHRSLSALLRVAAE